jgi:4-amino-4-deoxy-L-arabinose transferase-like glycosyltransferase
MRARHYGWVLALLVLVHAVLALGFAAATPFLTPGKTNGQRLDDIGAPDEYAHVAFVRHLLQGKGLPVLVPAMAFKDASYESHQPPLYYAAVAGFAQGLGTDPAVTRDAKWPLRLPNVLFGMLAVVGVWFLALWVAESEVTATWTTALVAFLPMNVALSGAVSNDPLLIALSTWTLALIVRYTKRPTLATAAGIGLLAGLAMLTKPTGMLLLAPIAIGLWPRRRDRFASLAVALVLPLLLIAPWWMRNLQLYGHPLATNVFHATFERHIHLGEMLSSPRALVRWAYVLSAGTGLSFVGIFGYMDIHLPYALYVPILVLLLAGLLGRFRRRGENPTEDRRIVWAFGAFAGLLGVAYIGFNLWQIQPQSRYLFPALGLFALAVVRGLTTPRCGRWPLALLVAGLLIADAYALATLPSAFRTRVEAARSAVEG